jgi:NADH dehydrogenase
MNDDDLHVVTGGLGYSGKYIVRQLIDRGRRVRTLTNSPGRANPFGERLDIRTMPFDDPSALAESLRGASVLYNTYWVRFNWSSFNHASAVDNTRRLLGAALRAGVPRIVHVSITNPSEDSPLEYFRGKALLERDLRSLGVSWSILRPTVLFGREDILINNIAWILRRFPVFGIFGDGSYRIQPVYVDDLAGIAVAEGEKGDHRIVDAIGPETFTFRALVETVGSIIGRRRPILSLSPGLGYLAGRLIGRAVGDVVVTKEEIEGLMAGLLFVDSPPAGTTRLSEWARENASSLGRRYASELSRRHSS